MLKASFWALCWLAAIQAARVVGSDFEWRKAAPESQGMSSLKLDQLRADLESRDTTAFLVIRNDRIVHEWYAAGHSRTRPHYTASMAKALVGGVSLALAMADGLVALDDRVSRFVPQWAEDPLKAAISVRHLGSHTSGIQDALVVQEAAAGVEQNDFSGWEGDFWRWRSLTEPSPRNAFALSRDVAPVLFPPGTDFHYSNPGIAMLSYVVTASLRGSREGDIRSLLRERIMKPIGVPEEEWSCGYGKTEVVDGLPMVGSWGGGSYSANATARVARLMLRWGDWDGEQLIAADAVRQTVSDAGTPHHGGMGWWTNSRGDLGRAPTGSFCGLGAGHQVVFVSPELDLICVRNGSVLSSSVDFHTAVRQFLLDPLMEAITEPEAFGERPTPPYPPSAVITEIEWAPKERIIRLAPGSDNWPATWADDGELYTAYGDGFGFEPLLETKLSLGLARVSGAPRNISGFNIRSSSAERLGDGSAGPKASGMLMAGGVLYMWVRNTGNSQLAWSMDHARSWVWADWRFTESFGCPTFLNFGRDYQGARDDYVYIYSPDAESAYEASNRMVMARVPLNRITVRSDYEFFKGFDNRGNPLWTDRAAEKGTVFSHPGRCYRGGITYNAGLKRYLWCQIHPESQDSRGPRFQGGFGIYDAPEPWGPWTTVYFTEDWDVGPGETSHFPTRWMSPDGRVLHLLFSGDDHFSVRRATLAVDRARSD